MYRIAKLNRDGSTEYLTRCTKTFRGYTSPVFVGSPDDPRINDYATLFGAEKRAARLELTATTWW